jgi:tetratricopeptide (TPR) repeat protein/transcriptional regulator with XRE-family HTH domain
MQTSQPLAFGTLLRRYRIAASLTQEELAARAGISLRSLGDMERGVVHTPRKDTLALLADALALSPQERAALAEAARRLSTPVTSVPTPVVPSAPPFVGRTRELALLERHIEGAAAGVTLALLLLAGEPGIGKTRLLHAAAPRAVAQGWCVLEGGCQRRGGHEPYAPILGALQRHLRALTHAQLRRELAGCAWLVRLLPELASGPIEPLPAWTLSPEQERRLMVAAVGQFLSNAASTAGTLLLLDDLQWADPDALDLLMVLVRQAAEVPVRVIGAYRDTEVRPGDPLGVMLADLAHAGLAVHHTLNPLTPEEATHLLAGLLANIEDVDPAQQQQVVQRAGGVPFFLVSYARGLQAGAGRAVPWDLAQGLRQRVAALPGGAQEVLGMAAVIGRVVSRRLLLAVATRGEDEVLAALEAACAAQLLREEGTEAYHFQHDVTREVVEADLGAARRVALHRRVAEALERDFGTGGTPGMAPVEMLAYHYARSDVQEKAVTYLEQAGEWAHAQYANAAAEGYYQDLVDRLDKMGHTLDAARIRVRLGGVLRTQARYEQGMAVLEQAAETYRAGSDMDALGRVIAQLGRLYVTQVRAAEGIRRLQPLREIVEAGGPSRGLAVAEGAFAHLFYTVGRYDEQLAASERAANLAQGLDDDRILAEAEDRRGLALLMLSRVEEALQALESARRVAEAAGDLDSLRRALNNLAGIHRDRGEFDSARLYNKLALAVADQQGDPAQIATLTAYRGEIAFFAGDWELAREDCERALSLSRQIGSSWVSPWPLLHLARLYLATGAWETASSHLMDKVVATHASQVLWVRRLASGLLAECDVLMGRPDAARARLLPLLDRPGQEEWNVTALLPVLAWAHLELGALSQAEGTLAQALRRARAGNHRLALAEALRVQALLTLRRRQEADAEHTVEEGLALARRMPQPYAEGRLLHLYGLLYVQKGERRPAREHLETAQAIFQQLGARKDIERVQQDLAAPYAPKR